mmetsp:Transcript_1778/g.5703  ORF Transcript_1778/g.5703 Transcript_1778/m.5703 type:complete len:1441 (-) Transcript_1778:26-4348(-)
MQLRVSFGTEPPVEFSVPSGNGRIDSVKKSAFSALGLQGRGLSLSGVTLVVLDGPTKTVCNVEFARLSSVHPAFAEDRSEYPLLSLVPGESPDVARTSRSRRRRSITNASSTPSRPPAILPVRPEGTTKGSTDTTPAVVNRATRASLASSAPVDGDTVDSTSERPSVVAGALRVVSSIKVLIGDAHRRADEATVQAKRTSILAASRGTLTTAIRAFVQAVKEFDALSGEENLSHVVAAGRELTASVCELVAIAGMVGAEREAVSLIETTEAVARQTIKGDAVPDRVSRSDRDRYHLLNLGAADGLSSGYQETPLTPQTAVYGGLPDDWVDDAPLQEARAQLADEQATSAQLREELADVRARLHRTTKELQQSQADLASARERIAALERQAEDAQPRTIARPPTRPAATLVHGYGDASTVSARKRETLSTSHSNYGGVPRGGAPSSAPAPAATAPAAAAPAPAAWAAGQYTRFTDLPASDERIVKLIPGPVGRPHSRPDEVHSWRSSVSAALNSFAASGEADARHGDVAMANAETTLMSPPANFPPYVNVKFFYPADGDARTVRVSSSDTVLRAVERGLAKGGIAEPASSFALKVVGTTEYIPINDTLKLYRLLYVRQCVRHNVQYLSLKLVNAAALGGPAALAALTKRLESFDAYHDIRSESIFANVPLQPNGAAQAVGPDGSGMFSDELDPTLLQVELGSVKNVGLATPDAAFIRVVASVVYGGHPLCPEHTSVIVPVTDATHPVMLNRTVRFEVQTRAVPRESKLCLTVFGSKRKDFKKSFPVGSVALQLVDFNGLFLAGPRSVRLWKRVAGNPFGAAMEERVFPSEALCLGITVKPCDPSRTTRLYFRPVTDADVAEVAKRVAASPSFTPTKVEASRLERLMDEADQNPAFHLAMVVDRQLVWRARKWLQKRPRGLPLFVAAVDFGNRTAVLEAVAYVRGWAKCTPAIALQLLAPQVANVHVRAYAVSILRALSSRQMRDLYILPLVAALKHEAYLDSALARFLVERAARSRIVVGHSLFWVLRAECAIEVGDEAASDRSGAERVALVLEAVLRGVGVDFLEEMEKEVVFEREVARVAWEVQRRARSNRPEESTVAARTAYLRGALVKVSTELFSGANRSMWLVTNPLVAVCDFDIEGCRVVDSFTSPIFLSLRSADANAAPMEVIFKAGDDLRQDALTMQVFRVMDRVWLERGLDSQMSNYSVIPTGHLVGFIEVVPNAETVALIQVKYGGSKVKSAFSKTPISKYLMMHNATEESYTKAVRSFLVSLSAYCVASYVVGLGDRHNDNLLVSRDGRYFQVDFARFLGNTQTWKGIKRERAPFVLTPEFVYVFSYGDTDSPNFAKFVTLCCDLYDVLRASSSLFTAIFTLMMSTGLAELQKPEDLDYLCNALMIDASVSKADARANFERLILESLDSIATRLNFAIHLTANAMRKRKG